MPSFNMRPAPGYLERLKRGASKPHSAHAALIAAGLSNDNEYAGHMDYLAYAATHGDVVWMIMSNNFEQNEFDFSVVVMWKETVANLESGHYTDPVLAAVPLIQALAYFRQHCQPTSF